MEGLLPLPLFDAAYDKATQSMNVQRLLKTFDRILVRLGFDTSAVVATNSNAPNYLRFTSRGPVLQLQLYPKLTAIHLQATFRSH